MRMSWLALGLALLMVAGLSAQQPAGPGPNLLDDTLQKWEKAMTDPQTFVAEVQRTDLDKTFNGLNVFAGQLKFMKGRPGQPGQASYFVRKDPQKSKPPAPPNSPEVYERLVYTGKAIYVFEPDKKVIRFYSPPAPQQGKPFDDSLMTLMSQVFGVELGQAKRRLQMTYVPAPPDQAKWYHFIKIQPLHDADKAQFSEAQLTLLAGSYLPRRIWFRQPNGNEVTWEFPNVQINVQVAPAEFQAPPLPQGWQMVQGDKPKVRS
jgi:TIGR03009 family protein